MSVGEMINRHQDRLEDDGCGSSYACLHMKDDCAHSFCNYQNSKLSKVEQVAWFSSSDED